MAVEKWAYVQTSSLVTLRNGNELSLDFGVVEQLGAQVVAIASLVGGGAKDINVINLHWRKPRTAIRSGL